jgi:hypothetical protein
MWVWVIAATGNVNVVGRGIAVLRTDDESKDRAPGASGIIPPGWSAGWKVQTLASSIAAFKASGPEAAYPGGSHPSGGFQNSEPSSSGRVAPE